MEVGNPPTAVLSDRRFPERQAPARFPGRHSFRPADPRSTIADRFSDESFRLRDIQFQDPQIGIATSPPFEVGGKLLRIRFGQRALPFPAIPSIHAEYPIEQGHGLAPFGDEQQH